MEKQITTLFSKLTLVYYEEVKNLLQKENSYKTRVNVNAINLLLQFIETSNDNDIYKSLSVLELYIGMHGILPDVLSPFLFLTNEASEAIFINIKKADEIDRCLRALRGEEVD